jgi:hypothetical protein
MLNRRLPPQWQKSKWHLWLLGAMNFIQFLVMFPLSLQIIVKYSGETADPLGVGITFGLISIFLIICGILFCLVGIFFKIHPFSKILPFTIVAAFTGIGYFLQDNLPLALKIYGAILAAGCLGILVSTFLNFRPFKLR